MLRSRLSAKRMKDDALAVAATLLVVSMMLLAPRFAWGQSASEIRAEIADHNAQIEELNKEIAEYAQQLDVIGEKKQTLQNTLDQLNLQRKKLAASISVTKNRIGTLELEIQGLSRNILGKEDAIRIEELGLAETIRNLHEAGKQSLALSVLSSENLKVIWTNVDAAQTLQEAMREKIAHLSEQKTSLTETKMETEQKQAELVKQRNQLIAEQGSLDATRRAQNDLLAQTKSQESAYQTLLTEKQAAKATFERTLEELESKLQFTLDPSRLPPAGKGILRWPLDNVYVTQEFGKTSASGRLYTSGTHNGVDFRASIGTPVRAGLAGRVVGVGNTDVGGCYSYGKWILVRHANGLSTLYAHLSSFNVSRGENVSTGAVIGYSGFTGYATGPHLHFSVFVSEGVEVKDLGVWYQENGIAPTTACAKAGVSIPVAARSAYLNPMDYL